jgi:hypothetical protein
LGFELSRRRAKNVLGYDGEKSMNGLGKLRELIGSIQTAVVGDRWFGWVYWLLAIGSWDFGFAAPDHRLLINLSSKF